MHVIYQDNKSVMQASVLLNYEAYIEQLIYGVFSIKVVKLFGARFLKNNNNLIMNNLIFDLLRPSYYPLF